MAVLARDLRFYGSASMPDDDSATNIGGAVDVSVQVAFRSAAGLFQLVSDDSGDTESVEIFYKDSAQVVQSEAQSLTGLTPVAYAAVVTRLLKAVKAGSTAGNVAVERQTAARLATAQAGTVDGITLDSGASAVDGAYRSMIIRITTGTGAGQIRRIVQYTGADKIALVNRPFSPAPDNTSVFRIAEGFFFEVEPDECLEVRRLHYAVAADIFGGVERDYYDKFFIKNLSGDPFITVTVSEASDPEGQLDFALESTVDGSGTNGSGNNRQVEPVAGVSAFSSLAKAVPGGDLDPGQAIGVWSHLTLPAGDPSTDTIYAVQISGT